MAVPRILINLLLLLGGLLLGLLFCESGIRLLALFMPKVAFLSYVGGDTQPRFACTLEEYVRDPKFLLNPHGRFVGCKTNSFGFNDEEFNPENTETIAIGDSFLFSRESYLDNVVTQLELNLQKQCGLEKKFSIANFGIPGLQPGDYLELIGLVLKKYKPKTIFLHLYLGNDFPQIANFDHLVAGLPNEEGVIKRFLNSNIVTVRFFRNFIKFLFSKSNQPKILVARIEDSLVPAGSCRPITEEEKKARSAPSYSPSEWFDVVSIEASRFYPGKEPVEELTKIKLDYIRPLEEISRICKERNIRLIAILSPSQLPLRPDLREWFFHKSHDAGYLLREKNFDWDLPSRITAKILSNLGIEFIDITPSLKEKMSKDGKNSYYALADTHWNENGNRAAAEIAGNLLKPLLCAD